MILSGSNCTFVGMRRRSNWKIIAKFMLLCEVQKKFCCIDTLLSLYIVYDIWPESNFATFGKLLHGWACIFVRSKHFTTELLLFSIKTSYCFSANCSRLGSNTNNTHNLVLEKCCNGIVHLSLAQKLIIRCWFRLVKVWTKTCLRP